MADEKTTDPFLPIANIGSIMKECLPANTKLTRGAKELVQESVTELICFVALQAQTYAVSHRRKTVNGSDIITALHDLGFARFHAILHKYYASMLRKS